MKFRLPGRLVPPVLLVLSFVCLSGCDRVDSASVQRWKTTPEAGAKLGGVVKNTGAPVAVRAEAAAALVEVGQGEDMEAAVSALDIGERASLIPAVVPRLAPLLDAPDAEKSGDARDALFALREQATTAEARKAIEDVLFPALVKDVRAGRARAGRYEVVDMLKGFGASAVPLLLPLLEDPAVPFATAVEVIDKVGDPAAREKGGAALVARAKKTTPVPETLWPAIGTLGGKQAAAYLQAAVERGEAPDVERAAAALLKLSPRTEGLASFAVSKAGNLTTPAPLREQLFAVAEQNHGEECRKALIALVGSSLDPGIRDRAFRAVLKASGGQGILEALEAYPPRARLTPAQLQEQIVGPLQAMPGMDTRGPLFKAFQSKAPLARLVAIQVVGNMGFKSDADPIEKLAKDTGTVPGLPPDLSVGAQARKMVAQLRKQKE
jgi:hypothetical protein